MSLAEYKNKRKLKPKSRESEGRAPSSSAARKHVPSPLKNPVNSPRPALAKQSATSGFYQSFNQSVIYLSRPFCLTFHFQTTEPCVTL